MDEIKQMVIVNKEKYDKLVQDNERLKSESLIRENKSNGKGGDHLKVSGNDKSANNIPQKLPPPGEPVTEITDIPAQWSLVWLEIEF